MKLSTALKGALALLLGYGLLEPWRVAVRHYDVALENLPAQARGLTIAQISDLHTGMWMSRSLVRAILELCAAQNPDVVLLTGDMVTRRNSYPPPLRKLARPVTDYAEELADELRRLKPPQGIWAVPGNHDLWNGDFGPIAEILGRAGVKSLLNKSVRLENGLALVGVDDLRAGHPDLKAAFAGVTYDDAQVVLNHNPRLAILMAPRNALILSGHTHGGQMRAPKKFQPAPIDSHFSFLKHGFYCLGRAQLYVSTGAGTIGIPMRFGMRPEITIFRLIEASQY